MPVESKLAGMFRSRLILIAIAALASVASGLAQDDGISIDSKVSPEQIKQRLQSSDSRQVAWGAYFASKSDDALNDDLYLEIMSRRLALWIAPPHPPHVNQNSEESSRISRQAISVILDALIERNQSVPASSLIPITSDFPMESLILAARLPADQATPFLDNWYKKRSPLQEGRQPPSSDPVVLFAGWAGILLAKAPPPGFAASILAESGERLSFWVADGMWQQSRWRGGSAGRCNSQDEEITPPPWAEEELSRWPPSFNYLLLQNAASPYAGTLLVDAGGERISYRRLSIGTRPSSCYGLTYFSEETRHHILAEMLRVDDKEMSWPANQDVIYTQGSKAEFLSALTRQIDSEESKFRATVKALREKGYLTESEANTVRPKLAVIVKDVRSPVFDGQDHLPLPLPKLVPTDSLTSISYDKR
jgi:hypothetical protein